MIRIAIVEDDKKSAELLQQHIKQYEKEKNEKIQTEIFSDGLDFISEYQANYDLILMDIEMPHMDGLDAARKVRQLDQQVCLIFVTNMAQYAIHGYEVQALDFMVKPVGYFNLSLKLDKVIRICKQKNQFYILIPTEEGKLKLDIDDIYYLESYKHYIYIHSKRGEYKIRSTMREFVEQLPEDKFVSCNKSYCVNLDYVSSFKRDSVMVDNKELSVSRTYSKHFLDRVTKYINRGGN